MRFGMGKSQMIRSRSLRQRTRKAGAVEECTFQAGREDDDLARRLVSARGPRRVRRLELAGEPEPVLEAAFRAIAKASELIDRAIVGFVQTRDEMQSLARDVGSRVVFMDAGQVIESNTPQEFFANPQHARSKLFLSQILRH